MRTKGRIRLRTDDRHFEGRCHDRVGDYASRRLELSVQPNLSVADLGEASHIEVVDRLVSIDSELLVDVGSGDGAFAQALAERGASVLAIEPDDTRTLPELPEGLRDRVTFKCAGGEAIPLEDGMAGGVFFNRSLHHVPEDLMDQALLEARRVLKADQGFLYVVEPDMAGTWSQLMKPFHDETIVRRLAIDALDRTASKLFSEGCEYWYRMWVRFDDFEAFATRPLMKRLNVGPNELETSTVKSLFEAGKTSIGYAFSQILRLRLYRGST